MTISLTCTCTARLEIDEKFVGQTIHCPDCQTPLHVRDPEKETVRTSFLALASLLLALVGAFTVVGTALAVLLGGVALVQIRQHPDRLAGKSYALAGVVLGSGLTVVTLFAFSSTELFGLDPILDQARWLGELDHGGPLEVRRPDDGFAITRPSRQWGVKRVNDFENVLLVNPLKSANVVVLMQDVAWNSTLEGSKEAALETFRHLRWEGGGGLWEVPKLTVRSSKTLPSAGDARRLEVVAEKQARGAVRKYLIYLVKKDGDPIVYVVAGGAPESRFAAAERELRQALDSFHLIPRGQNFGAPW